MSRRSARRSLARDTITAITATPTMTTAAALPTNATIVFVVGVMPSSLPNKRCPTSRSRRPIEFRDTCCGERGPAPASGPQATDAFEPRPSPAGSPPPRNDRTEPLAHLGRLRDQERLRSPQQHEASSEHHLRDRLDPAGQSRRDRGRCLPGRAGRGALVRARRQPASRPTAHRRRQTAGHRDGLQGVAGRQPGTDRGSRGVQPAVRRQSTEPTYNHW